MLLDSVDTAISVSPILGEQIMCGRRRYLLTPSDGTKNCTRWVAIHVLDTLVTGAHVHKEKKRGWHSCPVAHEFPVGCILGLALVSQTQKADGLVHMTIAAAYRLARPHIEDAHYLFEMWELSDSLKTAYNGALEIIRSKAAEAQPPK